MNKGKNLYKIFIKHLLDFIISLVLIIIIFPLLIFLFFISSFSTKEFGLFRQERVGIRGKVFYLYKFRSMKGKSSLDNGIAVLSNARVTKLGRMLRKSHLDELPQLFQVLLGEMSFVGPRPEVPAVMKILDQEDFIKSTSVRPGLLSPASLKYINEEEILSETDDPKDYYLNKIFPDKVKMNIDYVDSLSIKKDINILFNYIKILLT
jgi:lipopolysaccharide/colanic/teichoic acid biosynthesis glycosyltransferase